MFWSSPSADITIMIALLAVAFVTALASYYFTKRVLLGIFTFTLLSNAIIFLGTDYNLARMYGLTVSYEFIRDIYPLINIVLLVAIIIVYVRKKYGTADKN